MTPMATRVRRSAAGGVAAAAVLAVVGTGVALGATDSGSGVTATSTDSGSGVPWTSVAEVSAEPVSGPFAVNARGESYGSASDAPAAEEEPDLILAITDQGGEGYIRQSDLYAEAPRSPADAATMAQAPAPRTIVAYASDGTTRVGTFTIGSPSE